MNINKKSILGEIVIMVGDYISENPGITDEERIILRRAINEKSDLERKRRMQQPKQSSQPKHSKKDSNIHPVSSFSSNSSLKRQENTVLGNVLKRVLIKEEINDSNEFMINSTSFIPNPEKIINYGKKRKRTNSINSDKSNNSNDSTMAQQISFGDNLTQEKKANNNVPIKMEDSAIFLEPQGQFLEQQQETIEIDNFSSAAEFNNDKIIKEPTSHPPPLPMGSPPPPPPPSHTPIETSKITTTNSSLSMPFAMPPPEMVCFIF